MPLPAVSPSPGAHPHAVRAVLRRAERRAAAGAAVAPWLHGEIARRMASRLLAIKAQPATVLDWWAALGGGAAALRERYPEALIHAVEPTPALRAHSAQAACAPWWTLQRWRSGWRRASAPACLEDEAPRDGGAQLVWANMMLHWVADPGPRMSAWHAALAVDGFVMFSCLGPDTLKEMRALYRSLGMPPPGHAFIDMHDLGDALLASGFCDPVMDMETLTLTWADVDALLAELRGLGGNAAADRFVGLRTPRWLERLHQALTLALAGPDGRLRLSFEVIYGHAFKPPLRLPLAPETRVSLDTLRGMARASRRLTPPPR